MQLTEKKLFMYEILSSPIYVLQPLNAKQLSVIAGKPKKSNG